MNLLPSFEKRVVKKEYIKRLWVVGLDCLIVLITISIIPILVSYIVSTYEITRLGQEISLVATNNMAKGAAANMNIIKDANDKLDILNRKSAMELGYDISSLFSSIIGSSTVRLTSFSYDQVTVKKGQVKEVGHRISVGGIARDRDALNKFVKNLQSDKQFLSVDLPVSNLIENKDIVFDITIMVAKK